MAKREAHFLPGGPKPRCAPDIIDKSQQKNATPDAESGKCNGQNRRLRRACRSTPVSNKQGRERKKPRRFAAFVLNLGSRMLELLPIMLVFIDALAHMVLFLVELFLFTFGQVTIVGGHIRLFLVLDVLFAVFQTRSLPRRELAVLDPIRNAVLLICLAAIDFVDPGMSRIDLPWSRAGCVAVLGLSSGGADEHQTTHCQD